jgi:hypothetical protein
MDNHFSFKSLGKLYIDHLWLLIVLAGLVSMLLSVKNPGGVRFWELATLVAFFALRSIRIKSIDLLVFGYIFHCMFTFLWGDISFDIFLNGGVKCQLLPISFYFIARSPDFQDNKMFAKMQYPLMFAFISALFLYFYMPSWYMEFRTRDIEINALSQSWFEQTRLSGFWGWSYVIGYASLFYIMYELKSYIIDGVRNKNIWIKVVIAFLVLFFAQQRVTIAYCIVYIPFLLFVGTKKKIYFFRILFLSVLAILLLVSIIYFIVCNYMDPQFIDYILNRSIDHDSNLVEERFLLFEKYFKTISFLGAGLGKYSHYVFSVLDQDTISDCDYIRLLNEVGILGFLYLAIIIIVVLFMGIRQIRTFFYEFNIVLFLLASMIGAAPLEAWTLHPFMYWYCMGRIVNFNYAIVNKEYGKLSKS